MICELLVTKLTLPCGHAKTCLTIAMPELRGIFRYQVNSGLFCCFLRLGARFGLEEICFVIDVFCVCTLWGLYFAFLRYKYLLNSKKNRYFNVCDECVTNVCEWREKEREKESERAREKEIERMRSVCSFFNN